MLMLSWFTAKQLPLRGWELAFPRQETRVPPMGNCRSQGGKLEFLRRETVVPTTGNEAFAAAIV